MKKELIIFIYLPLVTTCAFEGQSLKGWEKGPFVWGKRGRGHVPNVRLVCSKVKGISGFHTRCTHICMLTAILRREGCRCLFPEMLLVVCYRITVGSLF